MASSSCNDVCAICQDDDVLSQAVTWCTECEVFLCMDCNKHHKKSPSSKYHKIMSTEDYHKLPAFMQEISSQCQEHNNKFELYCSFHACPCCVQCVTKHQKCQELKPLSDILTNVKSSASVQLLEKDLKVLKENLDEIVKSLKCRIDKINIQKTSAIEVIRTIRKSIDDYLNYLEQQILGELQSKHSKLKSNLSTLVNRIEHRSIKIHKLQDDYLQMTQYATKLQTYVGLREIEKTTSEATTFIENLESEGQLNENNLEIKLSSALQSILQDVKSFGDINITISPATVQVKAGRKDQAQDSVHTIPGIEEIKPSLLKTVAMPDEINPVNINACRILPDGNLLIIDCKKNRLLLFSKDGIFIKTVVTLEGSPFDLCIVRKNSVAISFQILEQLVLVDIEKNEIIETIKLSQKCRALASDGQILVICNTAFLNEKCVILNLKDMSYNILEGVEGSFISLFKENIYCTIWNEVSCYKRTGDRLWTFMINDMQYAKGLAIDINGYVYVAPSGINKVMVVTPDGKTSKTILSETDGIINPLGIDINRDTGMMIVSCRTSDDKPNILVYKI